MRGRPKPEEAKKNMSDAQKLYFKTHEGHFKGKKFSEEHCRKISEARKREGKWVGEDCPNWKGGVTPENDIDRKKDKYKRWRKSVFTRDNYTCQLCSKRGGDMEAHHKKPFADYKELRFSVNNGITLCKECHKNVDIFRR